jgi:metal iron transporter
MEGLGEYSFFVLTIETEWTSLFQPIVRRLFTRLIALIPSMVVAVAVGRSGIDALLVASQVVLSIVLPFITLPLLYLTSSKKFMAVKKPQRSINLVAPVNTGAEERTGQQEHDRERGEETVDFSNGKIMIVIGYSIWLAVVAANVYVIVILAINKG